MENEYLELADYYWDQAARVTARAKSAASQEHQQSLLLLARRWERLALSVEPPSKVVDLATYRTTKFAQPTERT